MLPDQYVEQLIGVYYVDFIQEHFFMHFSTVQIHMGNTFCRMLTHDKIQWLLKGHYMILVLSYFQYPKETQISILTKIYFVQPKMQREAFDQNINQETFEHFSICIRT